MKSDRLVIHFAVSKHTERKNFVPKCLQAVSHPLPQLEVTFWA